MTQDQNKSRNGNGPRAKQVLSDDIAEQAKRTILHGVGYKRPPESARFKKGQSGNPKGRPKSSDLDSDRSTNALVLRESNRPVSIREGEDIRKIPAIEAVHRAQYASATRGNAYSQKHIIERYDRAERERRQQRMEDIELWTRYVTICREAIAEAVTKKKTSPTPLPHPDDVVIDYERGIRFIGPISEDEVAQLEETLSLRDVLIIQDALDQREAHRVGSDDPLDRPGVALVFAHLLNLCVPERYRLSEIELQVKMMRYHSPPRRDLLKELYRAWRTLGAHPPRGLTFPPLRYAKQLVDLIDDHLAK